MLVDVADAFCPALKFVRDLALFLLAIPTLLLFPESALLFKREWKDNWFRKN